MRLSHFIVIIFLLVLFLPSIGLASPPKEELTDYLQKLEWTMDDLTSYLTTKNLTIEEFDTIEDLIEALGTPINESNIQPLLQKFNLTHDDLDDLLEQFGESPDDYTFIEDLESAVGFFTRHTEELTSITDFLSYIGMSDEEISELIIHIVSLDQAEFLTKLKAIDKRIEMAGTIDESGSLQENKQKELLSILEDVFMAYKLTPSLFVIGEVDGFPQSFPLTKLMDITPTNGKVIEVSLQSDSGSSVADLTFSSEMLHSDFVLQASEQLINVGQLASTKGTLMNGDPLPVTASSYPLKISVGLFLLLISTILMLFASREQMKRQ
ncbi:processed acidic surface protein [Bacillus suaedaesalsae]|uniref:Processed acidic surface protein n=1 Tax=Bacillus suaedaesalsae TaxID=2810349 RepID=A0ABS2DFB6_9BACI|nr:processed acidic surface protein [Bacillus suaedaesalsae]MBM6617164.1 processed acidic surface protein [Bacillus suaedaesalsae]